MCWRVNALVSVVVVCAYEVVVVGLEVADADSAPSLLEQGRTGIAMEYTVGDQREGST